MLICLIPMICKGFIMKKFRIESDSFGELKVPKNKYYGAQSARSLINFPIGIETMPKALIRALGIVKHSAANANMKLGVLDKSIGKAIKKASKDVMKNKLDEHFPLSVWQTGIFLRPWVLQHWEAALSHFCATISTRLPSLWVTPVACLLGSC